MLGIRESEADGKRCKVLVVHCEQASCPYYLILVPGAKGTVRIPDNGE